MSHRKWFVGIYIYLLTWNSSKPNASVFIENGGNV